MDLKRVVPLDVMTYLRSKSTTLSTVCTEKSRQRLQTAIPDSFQALRMALTCCLQLS